MAKWLPTLLLCIAAHTATAQQEKDYEYALDRLKNFYNTQQVDSMYYMLSDRIHNMVPTDKGTEMFRQLYQSMGPLQRYELSRKEGTQRYYKSEFANKTMTLVVSLTADNRLDAFRFIPFQEDTVKSNIVLAGSHGNIYGTLSIPPGAHSVPVVLIVPGSGPTDRNGNQPGVATNAYKMLADSLLRHNIATVRYDKRGLGESAAAMPAEDSLRFDHSIADLAGFIKKLKADAAFSRVIVLGHSEGSLVGMVAARQEDVPFISLAGSGTRADKLITGQLEAQSKDLAKTSKKLFDSVIKGYTVHTTHPTLAAIFRPSVQPYLSSWIKYDPAVEIKKLKQPVLIIQGSTDVQVTAAEAEKLKKAKKDAQLTIIPGMNHVLKEAPADRMSNLATYNNASLPLHKELIPAITTFIKGLQ